MDCRNCEYQLSEDIEYCQSCGAKVIRERITLNQLKKDFFNDVLGLDNLFFRTVKTLIIAPYQVVLEYTSGTRKRYMNPFAFLAIVAALSTFVINSFSDEYMERINPTQDESLYEQLFSLMNPGKDKNAISYQEEYIKYRDSQVELNVNIQTLLLKYFNIFVFLFTPVYAFMAFLVFGKKPFNYGEHLVANAYIVGFALMIGMIFFLMSLVLYPSMYMFSSIITISYYLITYKKINNLSIKDTIFKFLKFILVSIGFILVIGIIAIVLGVIIGIVFGINGSLMEG
ncbi:DUF3667 domain-containing protein [Aquimarina sp. AU474]|uniref:DUF3667 domain-containing protein n=1 Tax=Aquimarina sp. AU474 TaxID=2108529 RepID=UPI000D69E79A|nr:DUF3667 domain-containing protein [Aquimarina sp. AU474]